MGGAKWARVSEFFLKDPNLKKRKKCFGGVGEGYRK